jgi:hypothetical protein
MQNYLTFLALLLTSACTFSSERIMNINPLTILIECKNNPSCFFSGENMPIVIFLKNDGANDVELPFAFIQKAGPAIKLTDNKEKRSAFLKRNLVDPQLRKNLMKLAPGKSISIDWVLMNTELQQFGNNSVDLTVEVTVQSLSSKNPKEQPETINSVGSLRIVSKP